MTEAAAQLNLDRWSQKDFHRASVRLAELERRKNREEAAKKLTAKEYGAAIGELEEQIDQLAREIEKHQFDFTPGVANATRAKAAPDEAAVDVDFEMKQLPPAPDDAEAEEDDEGDIVGDGQHAYMSGIARDACPYEAESEEAAVWLEGWDDAQRAYAPEDRPVPDDVEVELDPEDDDPQPPLDEQMAARAEGAKAAERNLGTDANPYPEPGAKHAAWKAGWSWKANQLAAAEAAES